ncbi:D-alanyl-D-alanine carboxypeptidase [Nocardia cyriacigeorgica]|uniref:D-alanyl-D-alanine carboxypeptidase n=2 Tax=Nocardia cyriacigeorgica TaxID=135487 RepID=A0A6P1D421_9NOCA|nr:D-alanyl-D-alanine carboxypeptidase [Nocardia cyriacigeorgica]NEW51308.1 D-alanyl-D-alanine carboxypeptidase [Nocardia cyriacigeorgica]
MRTYVRALPAAVAAVLVVFAPTVAAAPVAGGSNDQAPFPVALQPDGIQARGAALAEGNTGVIVWSREADARVPIASLTKVMTAVVVLEAGDLERAVTVPQTAIDASAAHGGSNAGLIAGEVLTARQLLYAMMLPSGCDASYALAEAYGPGREAFIAKMNATAQRLGMGNTHFTDPSGLPVPDDFSTYSTPADLVRLGRHAMANPVFREIVGTQVHDLPAGAGNRHHVWENTNDLLHQYPGTTGIKTGSTNAAGTCLLFEARRGAQRLIGVVLHSSPFNLDAATTDAQRLMNWAFLPILTSLPVG